MSNVSENTYPVSLEEAKAHLNIIGNSDDSEITLLISASVDYIQGIVGRDLTGDSEISDTLKLAILRAVAFFYENRGDESGSKSEPIAAKNLALMERHSAI